MYGSSQPAPEPLVNIPAASDDENQNNELSFLDGVADAPVADTDAPDRLDASELPRAKRVWVMRQGCYRVSQSPQCGPVGDTAKIFPRVIGDDDSVDQRPSSFLRASRSTPPFAR